MGALLARLVDVRPGEGGLLLRSTAVLFGLIAGHTMLETARDALFLGTLPPVRLTWVYALLAVLSLGFTEINGRFVAQFGRRNALVVTLMFSAFGTVWFYLRPLGGGEVFALYVWSAVLSTVLVIQFWLLAGHLFTVSQGKRLFGVMAAGGVLGAVVGASVSIAAVGMGDVTDLLLGAAGVFLAVGMLVTTLEVDAVAEDIRQIRKQRRPWLAGARAFRDQPFLVRLGAATALATMTVLTGDYLFKSVAASTIAPEALGGFFAKYYTVLNAVALAVQVLAAGALVRRMGTIAAFLILPGLVMLGGVGMLITGVSFAAVLLTKGADGALRHSLHRISVELLWMPVPETLRHQTKPLIDAVIVRGSQAVAAGILFLLATMGRDRPVVLAGLVIVFAAAWLVSGVSLRRPYLELFRQALRRLDPLETQARLRLDIRSVEVVVQALSSRDEEQVLAAIDLLESNGHDRLIPALILYHESDAVLIRALEVIAKPERRDWRELTERLLTHRNEAVRVQALKVLARSGFTAPVEARLLDVSPSVRGQAAFWLASQTDDPQNHPAVQEIFDMSGPAGGRAQIGVLEAIRDSGNHSWADALMRSARSEDPAVAETALVAMARAPDPRFIPSLIERLDRRDQRPLVRDALVALGEPALQALHHAVNDPSQPRRVRLHVPRSLSKFRNQEAADVLFEVLCGDPDGGVRYKALRGLGRLAVDASVRLDRTRIENRACEELKEYLRMLSFHVPLEQDDVPEEAEASGRLLLRLLEDKQRQAIERAFRLLQIVHPRESIHSVSVALRSQDRRTRAQALEYIDALTVASGGTRNREVMRLVGDDLPATERLRRAEPYLADPPPENAQDALTRLLMEPDGALASLAAYHALERGDAELREKVAEASQERSLGSSLQSFMEMMAAREKEATGVL